MQTRAAIMVFKSLLAGLASVVAFAVLLILLIVLIDAVVSFVKGGASVGFDPISFAKRPIVWIVATLIFAIGFFWEYKRLLNFMTKR